jgi:hypothetical protein
MNRWTRTTNQCSEGGRLADQGQRRRALDDGRIPVALSAGSWLNVPGERGKLTARRRISAP